MKKKKFIIILVIIGILAGIFTFLKLRTGGGETEGIFVMKVSDLTGSSTYATRYSGVVEAEKTVDYKQQNSQTVKQIFVEEGQTVREGDPLFEYDADETKIKIASTNLDIEELNNRNATLQEQINELNAQKSSASGDTLLQLTTEIQSRQLQIRQNNYDVSVKQAEVSRLQQQVDNVIVKSTLTGTVKSVNDPSSVEAGTDKPIVSITQDGEYKITGTVDETNIQSLSVGMDVIVRSRIDESRTWKGAITEISTDPKTDNNNYYYESGTRTSVYPFYIALTDSDGLMLGQHVYIEQNFGDQTHTEGLWLDSFFIMYDDDGNPYVWKADRNKLVRQTIETGDSDENGLIEIISGLSETDEIAYPDDTCTEGAKVVRAEDFQ